MRPRYRPGDYRLPDEQGAFEVCIGALLTQNTAWTNVERALEELFRAGIRSPESVLALKSSRLQRLIRSSGYFRQKAQRLKEFSRRVLREGRPLRSWLRAPLPRVREELLAVRGIGPETADSMLLYGAGRPVFVVDAYTRRIGARVGWARPSWDYERVRAFFEGALPREVPLYQEYHALLVALAKVHCRTAPACVGCPLRPGCRLGLRSERPRHRSCRGSRRAGPFDKVR